MITAETHAAYQEQMRCHFDTAALDQHVDAQTADAMAEFKYITRQYALFHITFFLIACIELMAFVLFFSFLTQSAILAFSLAGLVLTGFSYFVLLFYFQAKKPEQLSYVRRAFVQKCSASLPFAHGTKERHLALSHALQKLIAYLHGQEYTYYRLPASFQTLSPLFQKFSVMCHWKDLHSMKELLHLLIVKEHVGIVKLTPTNLEAHAGLASSYLSLAKLYQDPRKNEPQVDHLWISPEYASIEMSEKFTKMAWRAVEEFKILDHYAPNDLWVHAQLASIYHDLSMPDEEIQEYEAILKIAPQEHEILFRLGILYFSQGRNAQALQLYDTLKRSNDTRAEELLAYYDAYVIDEQTDALS